MEISIIPYHEKGMDIEMYVGNTVGPDRRFRIVSREGDLKDRPHPGDLFYTAQDAKVHFEKLGHTVEIAPSQGSVM